MAISSHGTTFTFTTPLGPFTAKVLSISVEEAQPELVDMTAIGDAMSVRRIVATGDVTSPSKVQIDYLRQTTDLTLLPPGQSAELFSSSLGPQGLLQIAHTAGGISVSKNAAVESASTEMAVGDAVRGKITFVIDNSTTT
jgi:hypothetical protein